MTQVAWREDDFEEGHFDPCPLPSGTASGAIIENEHCPAFGQVAPDVICVGPDGRIIEFEAKRYSSSSHPAVVLLHSGSSHWLHGKNLILFRPAIDLVTGVALSRPAIDELSLLIEPHENVSGSHVVFHRGDEYPNVATHPLTGAAYEQLRGVPDLYRQPILLVLKQFVTSLPQSDGTKLPPLRLAALEDSSYLVEWIFENRRLGFFFDANPKDSGWFFVLSTASSERYESGTMDQLEMSRLIKMLLKR